MMKASGSSTHIILFSSLLWMDPKMSMGIITSKFIPTTTKANTAVKELSH